MRSIKFTVHGEYYHQEAIKSIAKENPDFKLSRKEILSKYEDGSIIHQYEFKINNVDFEAEPTNPYDPEAIKVFFNDAHIGYIRKGGTENFRRYAQGENIKKTTGFLHGGPYKIISTGGDGKRHVNTEFEAYDAEFKIEVEKAPERPSKSGGCCLSACLQGIAMIGIIIFAVNKII